MAGEADQTDVTNSEATLTEKVEGTDTDTSTTDQTTTEGQPKADDDLASDDNGLADDPNATDEDDKGDEEDNKDEKDGDEANDLIGAPEGDYDPETLELPEGFSLDADALAEFTPTAKALNLSPKGLSKLMVEGHGVVEKQVHAAMIGNVVNIRKGWETDSRALIAGGKLANGTEVTPDPVFGGNNREEVMQVAAKAIDRFTTANGEPILFPAAKEDGSEGSFRDFLKTTGLGNHPAMIRLTYLAGRAISEDTDFERGSGTPPTKLTREEMYYGDNAKT